MPPRLERWKGIHADLLDYVHERTHEILDEEKEDEEEGGLDKGAEAVQSALEMADAFARLRVVAGG